MPRPYIKRPPVDHSKVIELLAIHGNGAEVARITGLHVNTVHMINRKANGRCSRCGAPAVIGKTSCKECLEFDRDRMKKLRKERNYKGLCIACGEPRMNGSRHYCAKHRRDAADRNARYEKRKGVMNAEQKRRRTLDNYGPDGWKAWQRDGGACQICKTPYGEMTVHVHHIDEDRSNNTLENFACLCFDCHRAVHRLISSKNRKALIAWFERTYGNMPLR